MSFLNLEIIKIGVKIAISPIEKSKLDENKSKFCEAILRYDDVVDIGLGMDEGENNNFIMITVTSLAYRDTRFWDKIENEIKVFTANA